MNAIFFEGLHESYIGEILKEITVDKIYQPYLEGKSNLSILDIGANIGLFSLYASAFGTIHAFEPAHEHRGCFNEMITYNHLEDKITLHPQAISNIEGKTTLYRNGNITSHSLDPRLGTHPGADEVETWTIKSIFENCKIDHVDFMKIDVEGWEFKILGSSEFIEYAPKIHEIVGEYHTVTDTHPQQLENLLKDCGYEVEWLDKAMASIFHAVQQ